MEVYLLAYMELKEVILHYCCVVSNFICFIYIYIVNNMKNSPQYGFQIENRYQKVGSTGFLLL